MAMHFLEHKLNTAQLTHLQTAAAIDDGSTDASKDPQMNKSTAES
jgi:hypothetical protein